MARFVGFRSGEELADHYAAADVFAFASRTETFGNVVLEALASGLPAVVLADGGPAEIVQHGETGLAIPPNAPPSTFADALLALAEDAALRHHLAENARQYARSQSWEQIMGSLRERYVRILEDAVPAVTPVG
jgi:glycosyltransferase involved in cell wall biosynthesis